MGDVVVVIGSRPHMLRAAVDLGLHPVLVRGPGEPDQETRKLCKEVTCTDLFDEDNVTGVVERLYRRYDAVRVMSLSEDGLLPAARVNQRHGLGGNSFDTVRTLKDKSAMRIRLAEVGLSPVSAQVVTSTDELAMFAETLGRPVVVKPLDAGGSAGVQLLEDPGDAVVIWSEAVAAGRDRMLAEEWLDGPEISVETFSHEGKHTVVACTDKILGPRFIEVGHVIPAQLDESTYRDVVDMTTALLDAVGLTEGPSHTEFKITYAGPRIVESHNRVGGDNIPDLVRAVYGVDLERLAVGVPLGILSWDGTLPAAENGAAIRFLTPQPGVVRRVERPEERELEPGTRLAVTIGVGDTVPTLTWSLDRVAGHVMATGASGSDALDRCERTLAAVSIETVPSSTTGPSTGTSSACSSVPSAVLAF